MELVTAAGAPGRVYISPKQSETLEAKYTEIAFNDW